MNIKFGRRFFLIILVVMVVSGIITLHLRTDSSSVADNPVTSTTMTRFLMDTAIVIKAVGPDSENAVNEAFAEIERVEAVFSRHLPDSQVAKINQHAGEWVAVSPEVIELLQKGIYYGQLSGGAFDITIGSVIELWGFGSGINRVPDEDELRQARQYVDISKVEIDEERGRVRIPQGTVLDFGGIAKGYAVDLCKQVLKENRVISAMISAGGDIAVVGVKENGNPWRVGIQHPRISTDILAVVSLVDQTIVTSGDYERFFIEEGVRFHHIIDPATGFPARGVISVTIIADSAADGDPLSTAVFVLGLDQGKELIERLDGIEAVIVDEDGDVWVSSGLKDEIELL